VTVEGFAASIGRSIRAGGRHHREVRADRVLSLLVQFSWIREVGSQQFFPLAFSEFERELPAIRFVS